MLCFLCCLLFNLPTASATEPDHGLKLEQDVPNNIWRLTWPSVSGKTYFIQHTDDLLTGWDWLPMIEPGNGQMKEWGFAFNGDKAFWRLASSDIPTTDPQNDDFDGDGISNLNELMQGSSPLENLDLDQDGNPDDWERAYGLNPNDPSDGGDMDSDGDGLSNREEADSGTNPMSEDSDGDGINDDEDGWAWVPQFSPARLPVPQYAVIDLGEGYTAHFTNNRGDVVLSNTAGDWKFWRAGQMQDINSPIAGTKPTAVGLNNLGNVGINYLQPDPPLDPENPPPIEVYVHETSRGAGIWHPSGQVTELNGPGTLTSNLGAYDYYFNNQPMIVYEKLEKFCRLVALNDDDSACGRFNETWTYALDYGYGAQYYEWRFGGYGWPDDQLGGMGFIGYVDTAVANGAEDDYQAATDDYFEPSYISNAGLVLGTYYDISEQKDEYIPPTAFGPAYVLNGVVIPLPLSDIASVSSANHIFGIQGGQPSFLIDTTAGPKGDQPTTATPSYSTPITWPAGKPGKPGFHSHLNTRFQMVSYNGLWHNAKEYPLNSLIPAAQGDNPTWNIAYTYDLSDNGLIAANAIKISDSKQRACLLVPINLQSKDRILRGSIDIPEGWTQFGLSFKNKDTDQDFGSFSNLEPGATTDVKIYDSPDDFFSDEEMEENQSGSLPDNAKNQKVTFARDPENPRKLQFCAVFDDVGEIEIKLKFGPSQTEGIVSHTLTADAAMADFINTMNERVASIEVPGSEELPIDTDGDGFPNSLNPNDIIHGHQPGSLTIPGAIVHEELEDDPLNLVLPINSDDDDGNSQPDNADTTITSGDNDITRIVLKRPVLATSNGTLTLTVSNASAVRVFNSNGSAALFSYSVDLASPSGDLAGLAQLNGSVPIHVEGLTESADVTFTLTYRNTNNEIVVADSVHLTVADPASLALLRMVNGFQSVAGNFRQVQWSTYADNGAMSTNRLDLAPIGENPPLQNRGLLSKALWGVLDTKNKIQLAFAKGLVDGFWVALKGEKDLVVAVWNVFRDDPFRRCELIQIAIKESIDELKEIPADQLPGMLASIPRVLMASLYTAAEQQIPWEPVTSGISPDVIAYMNGFITGTVCEGVAISLLGVGLATKSAAVIKGIFAGAKAGQYALTMLNNLRKATGKMTDLLMKLAKSERGSIHIGSVAKRLEKIELPSGKKVPEVFTEALEDKPELTDKVIDSYHYHDQAIADEARAATRIQKCAHSLAELKDIMGNTLTDLGTESFAKLQQRMFVKGVDEADCLPELKQTFDLDSAAGKTEFNRFLEEAKTFLDDPRSLDPNGGGIDAPNRGFTSKVSQDIGENTVLIRYGNNPDGEFLAFDGTPKWGISLPPSNQGQLRKYRVAISFNTDVGRAAPWFGQPGGWSQIDLWRINKTVSQLVSEDILVDITP